MSQAVHDLLWVINSPSFIAGPNVATMPAVTADQIDAEALQAFLAKRGTVHRVGRYFEQLVHYWLDHVRGVEMLGAGLQIRHGRHTIGELDFVYRDEEDRVVHCEVSVKFFLHYQREGASDFPGPNASDSFEQKTTKLFERQLELSRLHYPSVERRDAIVKGMAFYRGGRPDQLPERMNHDHAAGSWLRAADLGQLRSRELSGIAIAHKPYWLSPQVNAQVLAVDDAVARLEQHFADDDGHPLMISLRDQDTAAEIERVFIVSARWPAAQRQ